MKTTNGIGGWIFPAMLLGAALATPACSTSHAGMTWVMRKQLADGVVSVGADPRTDAYRGDTSGDHSLPVLCLLVDDSPLPAAVTPDFYNGWAKGWVALTPAVPGTALSNRAAADALCAGYFGAGWRMAEHHDGWYGSGLSLPSHWHFWARGVIPSGTRFWAAIDDQPANPWNLPTDRSGTRAVRAWHGPLVQNTAP